MNKGVRVVTVFALVFLSLIFYNYYVAQKAIQSEKTSIIKTTVLSFPEAVNINSPAPITWLVDTPNSLVAENTTIYWSYESSPSALQDYDSPQAVGYPYHPQDYESGEFLLPSEFSVNIIPKQIGNIYFRSYARVQNRHLWSEEHSLIVSPNINVP